MRGMSSVWIYSGSNSDSGIVYTHEWNISPQYCVAQASFNRVDGSGAHGTGIAAYRYRPTPDGPEQSVSLGDWLSWPAYVYVDRMTSVTFGTAVGADQECKMLGNLFYW